MIAYFDTSAVIPLLVAEPAQAIARQIWNEADRLVSVRLVYPEARAALALASREGRLSRTELRTCVRGLDRLVDQLELIELDEWLVRRAGILAEEHALRGYDAVHLAAIDAVADAEMVVVAGDRALLAAAAALGIATVPTSPNY